MTPDPTVEQTTAEAIVGLALAIAGSAVVILIVGVLVARAAKQPFPASIVTSLTILASLSLIGYAVGGESRPELAAIAGTAVGALAGGVTALLTNRADTPLTPEQEDH